mmetsp:Transcript_51973/g.62518  ORF Transcript_51973/g.62518 Transcript_51973/m.62518 type:complete len:462 (-) Transcript_51973:269-1654(-)|eukprot:CAMPEP_0172504324 /NCGR_PEP_ID=MMETSP1066-20121228/177664_1 /TAXON_ID=671091 /ORGANISM="Coscinodiscus wailesii, Strain CCMP2513" /LENGTH=461 /DNA_ID=CAMNT_0013280463 /DNA_START=209 /DNA_END=1594 /DNA_ORIENTATION=+
MKRALAAIVSLVYPPPRIDNDRSNTKTATPLTPSYMSDLSDDDICRASKRRKLRHDEEKAGSRTPCLLSSEELESPSVFSKRRAREYTAETQRLPLQQDVNETNVSRASKAVQTESRLFRFLPVEVIGHCLSFLCSPADRLPLQLTCRHFRDLSDTDDILRGMYLCGNDETGKGGFIINSDTRETAQKRLEKFVNAGNLEAYYMMGMIRAYCFDDVRGGVSLLHVASNHHHIRSSYALGLILRDTHRDESSEMLSKAASQGFLPALQEILSAREMKARHGEPSAEELGKYLDPLCLSKLLSDHYAKDPLIRSKHTSHCWNPLCGRWAYKQTAIGTGRLSFGAGREELFVGLTNAPNYYAPSYLFERDATTSYSPPSNNVHPAGTSSPSHTDSRLNCITAISSSPGLTGNINTSTPPLNGVERPKVSRMKMCSSCRRAKYCSKLCQVFDWRSGRHKLECQYL